MGAGVTDVVKDELEFWVEDNRSLSVLVPELALLVVEVGDPEDVIGVRVVVTPMVSASFLTRENVFAGASVPLKETNVTPTGESTPFPLTGASTRRAWHATGNDSRAGASEEIT